MYSDIFYIINRSSFFYKLSFLVECSVLYPYFRLGDVIIENPSYKEGSFQNNAEEFIKRLRFNPIYAKQYAQMMQNNRANPNFNRFQQPFIPEMRKNLQPDLQYKKYMFSCTATFSILSTVHPFFINCLFWWNVLFYTHILVNTFSEFIGRFGIYAMLPFQELILKKIRLKIFPHFWNKRLL
jgi:hypothetical protein